MRRPIIKVAEAMAVVIMPKYRCIPPRASVLSNHRGIVRWHGSSGIAKTTIIPPNMGWLVLFYFVLILFGFVVVTICGAGGLRPYMGGKWVFVGVFAGFCGGRVAIIIISLSMTVIVKLERDLWILLRLGQQFRVQCYEVKMLMQLRQCER